MKNLEEGTRIHCIHHTNSPKGVIVDVLSTMYFVKFDDGEEGFIFKTDNIKVIK